MNWFVCADRSRWSVFFPPKSQFIKTRTRRRQIPKSDCFPSLCFSGEGKSPQTNLVRAGGRGLTKEKSVQKKRHCQFLSRLHNNRDYFFSQSELKERRTGHREYIRLNSFYQTLDFWKIFPFYKDLLGNCNVVFAASESFKGRRSHTSAFEA